MSISLEDAAHDLDRYDTTPILSSIFSAPLRAGIALVQIVAGTIFGIIAAGRYLLTGNDSFWNVYKHNIAEINNGFKNLSTAFIAFIPFIGNRILAARAPIVVLKRDADGYYTIPSHAIIPGVRFSGNGFLRSNEFRIQQGNQIFLDTKAKIVPPGWELRE